MSEPLTSFERAARLFKQAEKLGCDTPTESMIADAIQDAEFDTLHNPEIISARHGGRPKVINGPGELRADKVERRHYNDALAACARLETERDAWRRALIRTSQDAAEGVEQELKEGR